MNRVLAMVQTPEQPMVHVQSQLSVCFHIELFPFSAMAPYFLPEAYIYVSLRGRQLNPSFVLVLTSRANTGPQEATTRDIEYDAPGDAGAWLKDATTINIVFEFNNNRKNMHLNPHHMDMQLAGALFDKVNRACKKD
jgi:hypothetical protein